MSKTEKAREHIEAALMLLKTATTLLAREPIEPRAIKKKRAPRMSRDNGASAEIDKH